MSMLPANSISTPSGMSALNLRMCPLLSEPPPMKPILVSTVPAMFALLGTQDWAEDFVTRFCRVFSQRRRPCHAHG